MKENPYQKQFPDLMSGKRIMYVHGFASSAQSGTVKRLRDTLPQPEVIAYDLPVDPHEAIALLHEKVEKDKPHLIIGTSMGGMYTEQLYGTDRIVVNPAFQIADTMGEHGMTGKQTFLNPRQDGQQDFIVTKAMVKEYRAVQEQCFRGADTEEQSRVWGLFGMSDELVHTYPLFMEHYRQGIWFDGEHRMDDRVFLHSVVPVIRWIDDRQEGRERPVVYITIDALRDERGQQRSSAMKVLRRLIEDYQVFVVAPSADYDTDSVQSIQQWCKQVVGVPAYGHLVFTRRRDLLYGDYLVSADEADRNGDFMGTRILLGSDSFKTWEEIMVYFDRLGGQ